MLTVVRYIYLNPQRAGLCKAQEYPYTFIHTDGILSGYFGTSEELYAFLNTQTDEQCLEFDSAAGCSEAQALEQLAAITGSSNPQSIQGYDKASRDEMLRKLKAAGLSVRQISRLTGINRNVVQRA